MSILGTSQTERVLSHEQAQFCWRSEDSEAWNTTPSCFRSRIAADRSLGDIVSKQAASGWAVAQMDLD